MVNRTPTVSIILVFPIVTWHHFFQKWLCWLLMCAPSQIGQQNYHIMLVPCHDTKQSFMIFMRVLDLQELKKNKFLNVSSRAMTPRCLNFIPISGMGPRNSPEDTHVIFQPALVHWSMCLYLKFELCTQRWHVPSQNHEPSWEKLWFAKSLYQNLFPFCNFFTTTW